MQTLPNFTFLSSLPQQALAEKLNVSMESLDKLVTYLNAHVKNNNSISQNQDFKLFAQRLIKHGLL
jgi:hypothetical protein